MFLYVPKTQLKQYEIAAEIFNNLYFEITGCSIAYKDVVDDDDDIITFGDSAVNSFIAELIVSGKIPELNVKAGTDEYTVNVYDVDGRRILLLAGGLGRSTIYAVYDYFKRVYRCRYYWDGDVIPCVKGIDPFKFEGFIEKPKFQYRGIRYFAHRGVKRFQAEMWGFEDWKREIDYLLKTRCNLFMLRIGQDDLFQKAFPNIVTYPTERNADEYDFRDKCGFWAAQGFNDRRPFWSLEYRGKLRKQVLDYAFDRGLIHPEDCGTMTHWYSPTPREFTESKQPKLFGQNSAVNKALAVFDIRDDDAFDYYNKLMETHIKEYGRPEMFHTIGFAERTFSSDRETNKRMKRYVYARFLQYLREKYPNSPVLIAAWDLWLTYRSEEVCEMLKTLDSDQCIIFDYTSDGAYSNNFTKWGIVGKFPWVFGSFIGYESNNDVLGRYDLTESRLKIAKEDVMCKGYVLWPELSHSDTLMLEFYKENLWDDKLTTVEEIVKVLSEGRYTCAQKELLGVWERFLPIVKLTHWNATENSPMFLKEYCYYSDLNSMLKLIVEQEESKVLSMFDSDFYKAIELKDAAAECLEMIANLELLIKSDRFAVRDTFDIARTIVGRYIHFAFIAEMLFIKQFRDGKCTENEIYNMAKLIQKLFVSLSEMLESNSEISLNSSYEYISNVARVFGGFETTLKLNALAHYDRCNIYELVNEIFIKENAFFQKEISSFIETHNIDGAVERFEKEEEKIVDDFLKTPLKEMAPHSSSNMFNAIRIAADAIKNTTFCF